MHLQPFLSFSQTNDVGHYYSFVRPDIQTNEWYRFDDEFVTRVDFTDVIVDAYGGSCAALRKRSRSDSSKASMNNRDSEGGFSGVYFLCLDYSGE